MFNSEDIEIQEIGKVYNEMPTVVGDLEYRVYLPGNDGTLLEVENIYSHHNYESKTASFMVHFVIGGVEEVTYRYPVVLVKKVTL